MSYQHYRKAAGNKKNINQKPKVYKYRWKNPETGDLLTAGGILFYNKTHFWAIQESGQKGLEYNDIGGKYIVEDGDIFATIRRELYEETYGVCDILVSTVRKFSEKYGMKNVNDDKGKCVYVCVCVPTDEIFSLCGISDSDFESKFETARDMIKSQNPYANYKPVKISKISIKDIKAYQIGYRLETILRQLFAENKNTDIEKEIESGDKNKKIQDEKTDTDFEDDIP